MAEIIKLDKLQTVCYIKDEKGKFCSGHLKEFMTAPPELLKGLSASEKLYRCKRCGAIYASPPQQHLIVSKEGERLPPTTDSLT